MSFRPEADITVGDITAAVTMEENATAAGSIMAVGSLTAASTIMAAQSITLESTITATATTGPARK